MRVARYYNKKVKVKQFAEGDCCRLELNTVHSANGSRIGKDPFGWLDASLEMRIS
jgi:hypothetical protein